jgi:RNA polymerase sigma-70 factor (ECF subfamily)
MTRIAMPVPPTASTNPSIFLRLRQSDPSPREFAWEEFHSRYAPMVAAFAQRLGARPQDVDDVVQDVLMGFFSKSPTFVYDPSKGRFRGYLKVCTYRALGVLLGKKVKFQGVPLDQLDPEALAVDQAWNDIWEQELLARAVEQLRKEQGQTKTFQAFEQYVALNKPADSVAEQLGLHITSVYRAKQEITQLLREKVRAMNDED